MVAIVPSYSIIPSWAAGYAKRAGNIPQGEELHSRTWVETMEVIYFFFKLISVRERGREANCLLPICTPTGD